MYNIFTQVMKESPIQNLLRASNIKGHSIWSNALAASRAKTALESPDWLAYIYYSEAATHYKMKIYLG